MVDRIDFSGTEVTPLANVQGHGSISTLGLSPKAQDPGPAPVVNAPSPGGVR
jgi:hypothetical protein